MSKVLMDKINNILNIDKEKEYINFSLQNNERYIDLKHVCDLTKLEDFINNPHQNLQLVFRKDYKEILEKVKLFKEYNELNQYLKDNNIDYQYESNYFTQKWEKQNKKKSNSNKRVATFKQEEVTLLYEEFFYYKRMISKKIKDLLLVDVNKFDKLQKLSKKSFVEIGKQLLRLGIDFIQGHISGNYINAPLFLIDIEIEINDNTVILIKKSNKKLNEKLIIFILNQLNINYKNWDFNSINSKDDFINKIEPILEYKIEEVDESNNSTIEANTYRTIKYTNKFVLSLFDTEAGKIKEDFINLMNNGVELFKDKTKHDFEYYTQEEFKDNALIQINRPLNIYQKYALRSAINENTLIYGPPGTGKSEIITSIIANLLMKTKTVLVVSEKDAALNVIKERLSKLSIFAFYLKDIENESLFYDQIEQISYLIGSFTSEQRNEFDLIKEYNENIRVVDYNNEINKFRNILSEDIAFSLEKDSRNNDYRDYLLSVNEVENFVANNKNGVNDFWHEYQNKFVKLQSATEFIAKVAEFNWFIEKYELNEEDTNKFDSMRQELNRFLSENDISNFKLDSFEILKQKINKLNDFISKNLLNKDKDFMSNLENDCFFLSNNYSIWNNINSMLESLSKAEQEYIKKFLLKHSARHEKFLAKYISITPSLIENLLNRYYYKGEISTSKMLFKSKKSKNVLDVFVKVIQEFEKIKLFRSNIYLNQLINEQKELFDPIVIYFYNNNSLIKKSFIEFYNQNIINFEQRIIHQYYKYRVNQIERELININVYSTEKLNKNKHIIERDISRSISMYLRNNKDFILNIDQALASTYLKHIKYLLSKTDKSIQDKIEKMFQIVRMEIRPKINDFISEFLDCLKIIFPVWISKPELLSYYVPNDKGIYDVGIFDEASQMFLEKAYPMVYRCKQVIVSGDDKQLKPERISFNELDWDPDYRPLVKEIEFDWSESLLDRAKVSYWNTYTLKNHYRSESKELIEFSNNNFYEAKLLFSTLNNIEQIPLEINTNLKNKEKDGINKDEAKLVLNKLTRDINKFSKVIVICFSKRQKEYLLSQIDKLANSDLLTRIKRKTLVIGDLESVQGDEGELVIISTTYSKESQDYDLLSKPRGQNYLNVAITRARSKMIIFKSLNKDNVKIDPNNLNESTLIFKKWIAYLDSKTKELKSSDGQLTKGKSNNSSFKEDVFKTIKDDERFKGINIIQNPEIGSIKVDLVFYTESTKKVDLLIILDDWKKNLTIQDWFEDIDKEEYLKSRNYNLIRIREQDWLKDREAIINYIERCVKSKLLREAIEKDKKILKRSKNAKKEKRR